MPPDLRELPCALEYPAYDDPAPCLYRAPTMDHKWDVFGAGDEVSFHRSWTGRLVFRVRLVDTLHGVRAGAVMVDDTPDVRAMFGGDDAIVAVVDQLMRHLVYGRDLAHEHDEPVPVRHAVGGPGGPVALPWPDTGPYRRIDRAAEALHRWNAVKFNHAATPGERWHWSEPPRGFGFDVDDEGRDVAPDGRLIDLDALFTTGLAAWAPVTPLVVSFHAGDITTSTADVMVSTANPSLALTGGIGGRLMEISAPGYQAELDALRARLTAGRPLPRGAIVRASGGGTRFPDILHAVAIDAFYKTNDDVIAGLTERLVLQAQRRGGASVALPALATGYGRVPLPACARAMRDGVERARLRLDRLSHIELWLKDARDAEVFEAAWR